MKILALDSTETVAAAAITDGERLIGDIKINAGLNHSETLLPTIDALIKGAGLEYSDIDLFACSSGPGSFTGVRIGAATVKGLAFGKEKTCIGVSALLALAYNFIGTDGIICPVMDARRSQLYNAVFRSENGKITRLTPDRVISADELATELAQYDESIYFCGGGYEIARKAAENNRFIKGTPELLRYQSGYSVALCALNEYNERGAASELTDAALSPTYLRPSQAERMKNNS